MVRFLDIIFKIIFHMKSNLVVIIGTGIVIISIILAVILMQTQETDIAEVEDTMNREIIPVEEDDPSIQEKYDEVEKITNSTDYSPLEREWRTSGPFSIDRSEYAIGEKIFIVLEGLTAKEKGQIAVMRPNNATHYTVYLTIPFDGVTKSAFNNYLEPQISKSRGICSVDDLIGKWTLVFRGTSYSNLNFEINEQVVPGTNIKSVC